MLPHLDSIASTQPAFKGQSSTANEEQEATCGTQQQEAKQTPPAQTAVEDFLWIVLQI